MIQKFFDKLWGVDRDDNKPTKPQKSDKKKDGKTESIPFAVIDRDNMQNRLSNLLAPNTGINQYDFVRIGDRHIKGLFLDGYPAEIDFGFLDPLITFQGDCDTIIYMDAADSDSVVKTLTGRIEGIEGKLIERQKDANTRGVTSLRREYIQLDQLRAELENNTEKIIYVDVQTTLAHKKLDVLEEQAERLISKIGATKDHLKPADDEHDLVFKAVSPLAIHEKKEWYPFDLKGAANLYPFTSAEWPHTRGPLLGLNYDTGGPILFDGFNKKHVLNYGVFAVATSRRGKTALMKKLMTGEIRYSVFPAVIDPENEWRKSIEGFGGSYLLISRTSDTHLNPAEIFPEFDENRKRPILDIHGKIEQMTLLTATMAGLRTIATDSTIDPFQQEVFAYIGKAWRDVYTDPQIGMGLTEEPESLYEGGVRQGDTYTRRIEKRQRVYSDFYHRFCNLVRGMREFNGMQMVLEAWTSGREYGIFDCQTNVDLRTAPGIGFGLKELKGSILLPVGMGVVLSHLEERFLKKRKEEDSQAFRVYTDESQEMLDHPNSALFLETQFRRMAKRMGGPVAITQNFQKFYLNPHGQAVIQNSDTKFIGGQLPSDVKMCIEVFDLTEGEALFVKKGLEHHFLIKQPQYSARMVTQFSPQEQEAFFPSHGA